MSFGNIALAGSAVIGAVVASNAADNAADRSAQTSSTANALTQQRYAQVDAAVQKLTSLTPPNLLQYIQPYQKQVVAGTITPEEAVFKMQQATALNGIQVPQELLDAQRSALSSIQKIATEGGMTAIDRAQLNDIQAQQAARSAAEQGAIIQDAQQRGVAGQGLEMQARLISQQNAANRAAASGTQVAADAQARALAAMQAGGNMATTQRTQAVAEQQKVAEAQDQINNFNTSFQNSTAAANVAARNAAQASNLANAQATSNYNATLPQLEQAAKAAAAQQQWSNTFGQATNAANITGGLAGQAATSNTAAQTLANTQAQNAAAQTAAAITSGGTAVSNLVDAYGNYKKSQTKTEV